MPNFFFIFFQARHVPLLDELAERLDLSHDAYYQEVGTSIYLYMYKLSLSLFLSISLSLSLSLSLTHTHTHTHTLAYIGGGH